MLSNGRVVVVADDDGSYYNKLPYVVYCDPTPAWDWKPDSVEPVEVAEGAGIQAAQDSDTPYYIDRQKCNPAIAVDHSNNDVYVAFYARATPGDPGQDLNTDIYISRSTDGDESFPSVPEQLVHLTDLQIDAPIAAPRGPDQVMPSIQIDGCGGVSLVFYDNRNDPDLSDEVHYLDVYYVRITDFGTVDQDIYWKRLTPQTFELTGSTLHDFLGDYQHMAVAGPLERTLYPAYIAPTAQDPDERNCYVHQIRIFCLTDLNLNGESDAQDVALFEAAYSARDRSVDLTSDGVVDERDEALFWDVYANGCDGR